VHTPDVCYPGAGYEPKAPPSRWDVTLAPGKQVAEFWAGTFVKPQSNGGNHILRILWSWSADGVWTAPDNSRVAFASKAAICKLYVIRPMAEENERRDNDPCNEFIRAFVPELNRTLFDAR
jgi:hypothetical protein